MDGASTWVFHGQETSLAFAAVDSEHNGTGFDVFAGNVRGTWPHKHLPKAEDTYWDFSMDDYVIYDIPAFVEKIIEIKVNELRK